MTLRSGLWIKILLVALLNLILLLTIFLVAASFEFRLDLSSFLLAPARDRMTSISRLIVLELPGSSRDHWDALLAQYSATYPAELSLFDRDGSQLAGKAVELPPSLFPHRPPHDFPPRAPRDHGPFDHRPPPELTMEFQHTGNPSYYWAAVRVPFFPGSGERPSDIRVVWKFRSLWTNSFFFDYTPWLLTVAVVLIVSFICWLPLIRSITNAIKAMTTATGQIAEGHFEVHLSVNRHDELGRLSQSINRMADRLSGYVNGQRRFLGDIAHELCAPVARIQLSLGILEQRSTEESQPYVATIDEEVQHMSSLVNELLSFSKASLGTAAQLEKVNVGATIQRAIQRECADQSSITVDAPSALTVLAQPDYLFRSLSNVLRNAVRYAGSDGPIEIVARQVDSTAIITVSDHGPGVAPADLEQILKPFYRPESARQRETGGVGLGLAIVRTCIEACGGSVICHNREPRGLKVELRIPAAAATST